MLRDIQGLDYREIAAVHRGPGWNRHVAACARASAPDQRPSQRTTDDRWTVDTHDNDDRAALLVHAYVDGELDPANAIAIEQRMASEPALAAERERVEALRRALRERLPREAEPPALARAWSGAR